MKCVYCKEYVKKDLAIRQGLVSFCSEEHRKAWWDDARLKRKLGTSKLPRGTPGTRNLKARSGVTGGMRLAVRQADAFKCRFCGRSNESIQCHHVIYRSEAPKAPWLHQRHNLLTLCADCHAVVHSDKKRYQPLCLGIIWIRETSGNDWATIPYLERQLQPTKENGDVNS